MPSEKSSKRASSPSKRASSPSKTASSPASAKKSSPARASSPPASKVSASKEPSSKRPENKSSTASPAKPSASPPRKASPARAESSPKKASTASPAASATKKKDTPAAAPAAPAAASAPAASTASKAKAGRRALSSPFINVEPEYLLFPPPHHGRCIQNIIFVYNTSPDKTCVYKLRSQNPERYIAKPNVAFIAPGSATRIRVTLRDVGSEAETLPPTEKDRFRVSVKFLDKAPESGASAKAVYASTSAPVEHERDLMANFRGDMEVPAAGMVTYLPADYLPSVSRDTSRSPAQASRLNSASRPRGNPQNGEEEEGEDMASFAEDGNDSTTTRALADELNSEGKAGAVTEVQPQAKAADAAAKPKNGHFVALVLLLVLGLQLAYFIYVFLDKDTLERYRNAFASVSENYKTKATEESSSFFTWLQEMLPFIFGEPKKPEPKRRGFFS